MYKVLHIMGCSDVGGVSSVVLNYYRWLDRAQIKFDIAFTSETLGKNAQTFEDLGANIYQIKKKSADIAEYEKSILNILEKEKYDAIHVHENMTSFVALRVAKKYGVKKRVAHSHMAWDILGPRGKIYEYTGRIMNSIYATDVVACGKKAGDVVFGKWRMRLPNAYVLPNAIDVDAFSYNLNTRSKKRRELDIQDKFVIGMVGRLSPEKNHIFAVDLINEIRKKIPEAILLCVGDGAEMLNIQYYAERKNNINNIIFLGSRTDIAELDQAIDVAILPSLSEGFPVAVVEYMAAGLPVVISDRVTNEFSFGQDVTYLSLKEIDSWVNVVCKYRFDNNRDNRDSDLREHNLDIKETAKLLLQVYLK